MRFTRALADVFGDQLEQDRIRQALVAARPALAGQVHADEERPLLQILRPRGAAVLVAKTSEGPTGAQWVVGVPGTPEPTLHEATSSEEIVRLVLDAVDGVTAEEEETDPAGAADDSRAEPSDG
ncbi:hypothetical protein [Brachybacterium fresconis]|uniref:Uncharacterized protein n=1 Tax=Brachybacterium fresconis TaxID=173363 RepID=A0ABS4YI38_9MICO|nr:hypothetical protein [Brachybacterium fresconis]MBP2408409.1 hypothetical protein [Brachybacterium fresconis]